ncbi:MAG: helix-turn-helix transcriptional regulator, partial [Dermatophilaceae bacterium]
GQRVSRWERGEARPRTPQSLHALAAALELEPTSLLVRPGADGPSLRWLRFAAGVSAVDFATAARTSVSTVKRWERDGLVAPDDDTVDRLAAILKAAPGDVRRALRGQSGLIAGLGQVPQEAPVVPVWSDRYRDAQGSPGNGV